MTQPVTILLPRPLRIYSIAFGFVWCGFLLFMFVALIIAGGGPVLIFPLAVITVMLGFGAPFIYRSIRLAVIAEGDQLIVRNRAGTRRFHREEVEGFRLGAAQTFGKTIYLLLGNDDIVGLDVSVRSGFMAGTRDRQLADLIRLQAWVAEGREPSSMH
jgi:hypothetical protein